MNRVNFILQGKGGVGKSFIASILAQYEESTIGKLPLCIDTDPVNTTLYGFKSLNPKLIEVMEDDEINPRLFDNLIEATTNHDGNSIVDNGASSFIPLSKYLIANNVPEILTSLGYEMVVHTIVTGGQSQDDTINGMTALINSLPENVSIVVWLNHYFGKIEREGKTFEQFKAYQANKRRISALINIPIWQKETFGYDVSECLKKRHTFDQGILDGTLNIMARQRLKIAKEQLFKSLNGAIA